MPEDQKNLEITASYIGPIISLKSENGGLSSKQQNLIFARNGMGKSFLSRAFRYLDIHQQEKNIDGAAYNLVSEESPNNEGGFEIKSGSDILGKLQLKKGDNNDDESPEPEIGDKIFHVFCSEFIQEELRENAYQPDAPDPNREIVTVDGGNIELDDKRQELRQKEEEKNQIYNEISTAFNSDKMEMKRQTDISGNLKAFQELTFDNSFLQEYKGEISLPDKYSSDPRKALEILKSIPDSLTPPEQIEGEINVPEQLIGEIFGSLKKETSPASIADVIKEKIEKHLHFFETGVDIHKHNSNTCPFCEQETTSEKPKRIIEAYIEYFKDAEAEHKKELKKYRDALQDIGANIEKIRVNSILQKSRYDELSKYIPTQPEVAINSADLNIEPVDVYVEAIINEIEKIEEKIDEKEKNLKKQISMDEEFSYTIASHYNSLKEVILSNDKKFAGLKNRYENISRERKNIQGLICEAFKIDFAINYHAKIDKWYTALEEIQTIKNAITALESKQPTASARERVAEIFQELLRFFFENKYTFCKNDFAIKRGNDKMSRGADRTLSDGEKTIIGFCWFIASIHLKVESDSDYKKLFLVFDDPMTSLSYDYIFSMADVLKSLSISSAGTITVSPKTNPERPQILILTHSDSFFNICLSNSVVKKEACFALEINNNSEHKLSKLPTEYIIPFQSQLEHIHDVKQGQSPAFYTANSIRSVLEFFFRICRPYEAENMVTIAEFIYTNYDINIRRVLLHGHSHGTHVECNSEDELIQACKDTIKVIKELAPGQIDLLDPQRAN